MESASFRFPETLLTRIDAAHGPSGYPDRSGWVRAACREKLNRDRDRLPPEAQLGNPTESPSDA